MQQEGQKHQEDIESRSYNFLGSHTSEEAAGCCVRGSHTTWSHASGGATTRFCAQPASVS